MENFYLSYEKFLEIAYGLCDDIKKNGRTYQAILCPLRGGFFLSYFMSNHLSLPMRYLEISSYDGTERRGFNIGNVPELTKGPFLLCDDIYDSGNTIRKIREIYAGIDFDIAVVLAKKTIADMMYGELVEADRWVDFFWEVM